MPVQKYDIRRPESEGGGFEERYWSPQNSPVLGSDREVAYIIHCVEDVTEMVRLKKQGIEQEKVAADLRADDRFRKAFNASPDSISIATMAEARYVDVNAGFSRITGYRREEVIGRTALELGIYDIEHHRMVVDLLEKRVDLWIASRKAG